MEILNAIKQWMGEWEPIWLFVVLLIGIFLEWHTLRWTIKEFYYDKEKDEKKQKRTKTTKKTTSKPGGDIVTEEQTETVESVGGTNEAKDKEA